MTYKKFLGPVLTQSCQNLMKFLVFILLQLCFGIFFHRSNFEVNGYLFFYFCLKKKYKIIFIYLYFLIVIVSEKCKRRDIVSRNLHNVLHDLQITSIIQKMQIISGDVPHLRGMTLISSHMQQFFSLGLDLQIFTAEYTIMSKQTAK